MNIGGRLLALNEVHVVEPTERVQKVQDAVVVIIVSGKSFGNRRFYGNSDD
jgi:hypothetical protein